MLKHKSSTCKTLRKRKVTKKLKAPWRLGKPTELFFISNYIIHQKKELFN